MGTQSTETDLGKSSTADLEFELERTKKILFYLFYSCLAVIVDSWWLTGLIPAVFLVRFFFGSGLPLPPS